MEGVIVLTTRGISAAGLAVLVSVTAASTIAASMAGAASQQATSSATYLVSAKLDAKHEVPAPKDAKNATGTLSGKLILNGKKSSLVWQLRFSGLSGKATASHLHFGVVGKSGLIALPLCVPCTTSPTRGEYHGPYVAIAAFVKAILHGGMYVNIHTKLNPNGEIRGQVKAAAA
jgi:hypothetical protein